MRRYTQKIGDQRRSERPAVSRRVMLIASGGLMLGVAGAVGCANQGLVGRQAWTRRLPRPGRSNPADRWPQPGRTGATDASPHPTARAKPEPRPAPTATDAIAPAHAVYYVDDGPKVIALTIDDGPSPVYTPQVLRILAEVRRPATFLDGRGERELLPVGGERRRGGRAHDHQSHGGTTPNLATSLTAVRAAAGDHAGDGTPSTPPPACARGCSARPTVPGRSSRSGTAQDERLTPLDWSVDPRDWARPGVSEIVGTIMKTTRTGSIILEHDGGGDRSQTVAALKIVIPRLLDEGYHFRSV